ncbi:YqjF family protein [Natronococcus occultus]|uniref:DUF2071 domain-containing protein n=1 Tax=Natronococcus occultus SP4 TaxID=694430 RepID=L0K1T4_9EURY|nr:DUF2071 domain-containing protein [Natronococcus occultus]AGB38294.1 hypothetical protein Natoc_2523 [Natronococcus occultus SP4]
MRNDGRTQSDPARWPVADEASPKAPYVGAMTWRKGLFVHWPIDPEALRPHVPDQLTLETRDGQAWLSVLPFVLADAGVRGTPAFTRVSITELNVRTYVEHRGDPALYFFSVDVDNPVVGESIGRATRLPVYTARMSLKDDGDWIEFSSERRRSETGNPARFAASYRPDGDVSPPETGSLAYWLTERRRFYAPSGRGVMGAEIAHDPWPLQPAEATIQANTMFAANGLPSPTADPVVHYCDRLPIWGSIPRWLPDTNIAEAHD